MENLSQISNNIRKSIIRMVSKAGSGHTGGSLGMADVFTVLYYRVLDSNVFSEDPDRDRFILSNGHICPVWYATLAELGKIPKEELQTLRQVNSRLQGHPVNHDLKYAELPTGSLGQGISAAVGLALGYKIDKKKSKVYVSVGDGEMDEGSVWEALMAAGHYKLDNLIAFMDRNMIQQAGRTEEMMSLEPLADKVAAFNWHVIEADGNDIDEAISAFDQAKKNAGKPTMIIFKTKLGQGVSFVLDKYEWHGQAPSAEQMDIALKELGE
jgi:transketolase